MDRIKKLNELGQSLWYDNIQRRMLENGEMADMIAHGLIRGVTSNPSIFNNAIAKSSDYDSAIRPMSWAGWSANQIFDQLTIEDIKDACDLFAQIYQESNGGDGYVSIEVSPLLGGDTAGSLAEAKRLWNLVNRPNLFVKIPATAAGIPAIRDAIAAGININITLIFSLERYREVIDAYMSGLEQRVAKDLPIEKIASVASFFVSRVDTKVDQRLEQIISQGGDAAEKARLLLGKAGIANARKAYARFLVEFGSERFKHLHDKGARLQRPLWASTSTKNPAYRDVLYVEELVGANTVNTVPPQTLTAFMDHGEPDVKLGFDVQSEQKVLDDLEALGISMDQVTFELEVEGVKAFSDSYDALLATLEKRRAEAQAELGPFQNSLPAQIVKMDYDQVVKRLFDIDGSLWTADAQQQKEIQNRLGWLVAPQSSRALVDKLNQIASECIQAGYQRALLLGMGGSSLAPEVLRLTNGVGEIGDSPALDLEILDSTDPAQVSAAAAWAPVENSVYIVSSKSGTTSEVNAYLEFFWDRVAAKAGKKAGLQFIAITDPGTKLETIARERGFRAIVSGDPMVGGRNSALTSFGLLPAALIGMDVHGLLDQAQKMMNRCLPGTASGRNPGLVLGTLIGEAALVGRDKLTIIADPGIKAFGSWLEQLVAESTGKNGRGIVPVDLEPETRPENYGGDRLFVYLRMGGERAEFAQNLRTAGQPVLEFPVNHPIDLGAEFYRWEIATAIACYILGVNAFDQPDVQDNKTRTSQKIAAFKENGVLEGEPPVWEGPGGKVFGMTLDGLDRAENLKAILQLMLKQAHTGDYIAVNAYLPRDAKMLARLQQLRKAILDQTGCATTLGFGPRFLHSTGQLHKGGANNGVFIQITETNDEDLDIPTMGISFATLELAQALGDLEALISRGRRAVRIHLNDSKLEDLY